MVSEPATAEADRVLATARSLANDQYVATWSEPRPARTLVQVAGLPRGATVEIDAIAHRARGEALAGS